MAEKKALAERTGRKYSTCGQLPETPPTPPAPPIYASKTAALEERMRVMEESFTAARDPLVYHPEGLVEASANRIREQNEVMSRRLHGGVVSPLPPQMSPCAEAPPLVASSRRLVFSTGVGEMQVCDPLPWRVRGLKAWGEGVGRGRGA